MWMMLLALSFVAAPDGAAWPGFLGAGAAAIPAESLPLTWSPSENIAWTAQTPGYGQSSPVIWGDHVYITAVAGDMKDTCLVIALSLADGKELWRHSIDSSFKVKSSTYVSRAAPTSVADQDGVIAFFESGDLVALDHQGQVRWQRSLSKDFGEFQNQFGLGASLAQIGDRVFVLADHEGPSYLVAVGKLDGKTLWKTDRESRISWSSPTVMTIGGQPQVVVSSSGNVDGYDAESGKRLWSLDGLGGNTVSTPILFGDGMFLVGASAGERGQYAELAPKSNIAVRLTGQGPSKVWTAPRGAQISFASPMTHDGFAYWVTRAGVVYCLDAKTGEEKYTDRIADSCWATPVGVGDRIYFFGRGGKTTVIAAGPTFQKLAENQLWSEDEDPKPAGQGGGFGGRTLYGSALAPGSLLLRTGDRLYCLRNPSGG